MRSEFSLNALISNIINLALITSVITISYKASSIIFDTKLKQYLKNK
jgi:hypothetical protein